MGGFLRLICLVTSTLIAAAGCYSSVGSGGAGGGAGTGGVAGSGGDGGAAGIGGAGGESGHGGDGGTGGLAGSGGTGGASGSGGSAGAGGTGGNAGTGGTAGMGGSAGTGGNGGGVCPEIRSLTATPDAIPPNESQALVEVDAFDPDGLPDPLVTRLSALTGTFDDPTASAALYTCGAPGFAAICVVASDGNRACDVQDCIPVACPSSIPPNVCPRLMSLNAIPSNIPPGEDSTDIQVRADDPDSGPLPLTTTLYALRGTFDDPNAADTVYRCERSGLNEICADASDGACVKTACIDVHCPDDLDP